MAWISLWLIALCHSIFGSGPRSGRRLSAVELLAKITTKVHFSQMRGNLKIFVRFEDRVVHEGKSTTEKELIQELMAEVMVDTGWNLEELRKYA